MAEPLHLKPDPEPAYEQIRLGDQTLELDPASAQTVRDAFESLAAQYGAALENLQRQTLQQVGTSWVPPVQPQNVEVPDPDVLFQNKQAWTDGLASSLQQQLGGVRAESAQLVQGAVQAFQQELQRRDAAQAAQQRHDAAMEEMLERRNLGDHTRIVQAIYNEQYDKLKHLPLELALDRIGAESEAYIQQVRSGEKWEIGPGNTQTGVAPRPPRMLRTAQRAPRAAAPPPGPSEPEGGIPPNGDLGMMGRIIRKRQAQIMGGPTA